MTSTSAAWYGAVQCGAVPCGTVRFNAAWYGTVDLVWLNSVVLGYFSDVVFVLAWFPILAKNSSPVTKGPATSTSAVE